MTEKEAKKPVLLTVMAHPDDESFGMGGTLAYYARRGVDCYLICATRGEAGLVDEAEMIGFGSIGEKREIELRCAAGKLGLKKVIFLDYRDSGMLGSIDNENENALIRQPNDKVAGEIANHIRQIQPDVVVTFDPIGGYHHPDHIYIHQATVQAFDLAGDESFSSLGDLPAYKPQKLYFQSIPKGMLKFIVAVMRLFGKDPSKFGRNKDIDMAAIARENFPRNAIVDYLKVALIKDQASACHHSQLDSSLTGGIFAPIRRFFASRETFMRAYPAPTEHVEHDLFEGIAELPPLSRTKLY
mgnify:CR=1 FL=1